MNEDVNLTAAPHGGSPALRAQGKWAIDSERKDGVVISHNGFYMGIVRNWAAAEFLVNAANAFSAIEPRGLSASEGSTKPEAVNT